jgi:phosphatidylinositol glycan class V
VGLFRYWTISNLPLFLLAAPTLFVLLESGVWGVQQKELITSTETVFQLAISQLLLAGMAVVGYHVQIITRLSSGCAVWYWWVAAITMDEAVPKARPDVSSGKHRMLGSAWVLRWMIMYGLIQGVLYTGFLPPA